MPDVTTTPQTADVSLWMAEHYPTRTVRHSTACDRVSRGDECVGGCLVEPESMYVVCRQCGESFDDLAIAGEHAGSCGSDQGFDVLPESEAM